VALNLDKISITNAQLSCFKLHLQQLLQVKKVEEVQQLVVLNKAYSQSLCFHFVLVYRAFLQEIAADYQIKISLDGSFADLNSLLDRAGIVSLQCQMLADLEQDAKSWLSVVLARYQDCLSLVPARNIARSTDAHLIGYKELPVAGFEEEIELAGKLLKDTVEQYRDLMQEW